MQSFFRHKLPDKLTCPWELMRNDDGEAQRISADGMRMSSDLLSPSKPDRLAPNSSRTELMVERGTFFVISEYEAEFAIRIALRDISVPSASWTYALVGGLLSWLSFAPICQLFRSVIGAGISSAHGPWLEIGSACCQL